MEESFNFLMKSPINDSYLWEELSDLYNKYKINNKEQNIPKKIHQIWLGGELPTYYNVLIESIKKNNPDWEYKLWTDKDIELLNLKNKNLFNTITNNGLKADLLRYEILYNEGGVYLDVDFYCIKPFGDLFLGLDFFTSCGHVIEPEVFNGLFGCTKKHPLMEKIIDGLINIEVNNDAGSLYHEIGSKYFSRNFFNFIESHKSNIVVFPTVYFYPYPALDRFQTKYKEFEENNFNKIKSYLTEESYVIHFWHSNWQ